LAEPAFILEPDFDPAARIRFLDFLQLFSEVFLNAA
jgi:hypothetical protein